MAMCLPQSLLRKSSRSPDHVPKGHVTVYVGKTYEKKRFIIPGSYLNRSAFHDLLSKAKEEFGFEHPMGGLTIPCNEDTLLSLLL